MAKTLSPNRGGQSPEVFEKGNSFACFLNQVTMAVIGSLAVPNCSSGHLPTLLPMSGGCAQVPVDQKPGPRIWSLQLSCQGAVFPCRVLRAHEGKLLEGPKMGVSGFGGSRRPLVDASSATLLSLWLFRAMHEDPCSRWQLHGEI